MSHMESQVPPSKSKPVRILGTILAILVAAQGYISTLDEGTIPDWVKLVIGGGIVVATAGLTFWTEGQTVPWKSTVARYVDQTGEVVAGPAAKLVSGVATNDAIQVTGLPPAR